MKRLLALLLVSATAFGAPSYIVPVVKNDGQLQSPTNFWTTNYVPTVKPFSIVVVPDPQMLSASQAKYSNLVSFVRDNKTNLNIQAVIGVGDNLNTATDAAQRAITTNAWLSMANYCLVLPAAGQHDMDDNQWPLQNYHRWWTNYNSGFGWATNQTGFVANYNGALNVAYEKLINGQLWLFVQLGPCPLADEAGWAGTVIAAHSNSLVWVTTHANLYTDGNHDNENTTLALRNLVPANGWYTNGYNGADLYQNLTRLYPNIRIVTSGHYDTDTGPHTVAVQYPNNFGGAVNEIVTDYQNMYTTYDAVGVMTFVGTGPDQIATLRFYNLTAGTWLTGGNDRWGFRVSPVVGETDTTGTSYYGNTNSWRFAVGSDGVLQIWYGSTNRTQVATILPDGTYTGGTLAGSYLPIVVLPFSEGSGTTTTNDASLPLVFEAQTAGRIWTNGIDGYAYTGVASNWWMAPSSASGSGWSELTVSCWINVPDQDKTALIASKHVTGGTGEWFLFDTQNGESGFWFRVVTDTGAYIDTNYRSTTHHDGQWHHVAATFKSGRQRLYLDGSLLVEGSQAGRIRRDNSSRLAIGNNTPGNYPFNGNIDMVKLYNRELSPAEIAELAQHSTTPTAASTRIFRLTFTEGMGTNTTPESSVLTTVNGEGYPDLVWQPGMSDFAEDAYNSNIFVVPNASWAAGSTNFTAMAWVKLTNSVADDAEYVMAKHYTAANGEWGLSWLNAIDGDGRFRDTLRFHTVSNATTQIHADYATTIFDDYLWHHVAGTMSNTVMRLYLDGALVATATNLGPVIATTNSIRIGSAGTFPIDWWGRWHGSVDNAAYWTEPLTSNEILATYRTEQTVNARKFKAMVYELNGVEITSWASGTGDVIGDGPAWTEGYFLVAGATDRHAVATNAVTIGTVNTADAVVTNSITLKFGGVTNHVMRTIDVTQPPFNADATGVADATAAIQAAIDYAGDQTRRPRIWIPAGSYSIVGTVLVDHTLLIEGDNAAFASQGTVLTKTGTGDAIKVTAAGSTIHNLYIQCGGASNARYGLELNAENIEVKNVRVYDARTAFVLNNAWSANLEGLTATSGGDGMTISNECSAAAIRSCEFSSNTNGIRFTGTAGSSDVVVDTTRLQHNAYGVIITNAAPTGFALRNAWCEHNTNYDCYFKDTRSPSIAGGIFATPGGTNVYLENVDGARVVGMTIADNSRPIVADSASSGLYYAGTYDTGGYGQSPRVPIYVGATPFFDGNSTVWSYSAGDDHSLIDEDWMGYTMAGKYGWASAGAGAGVNVGTEASETGHFGLVMMTAGTTSTGYQYLRGREDAVVLGSGAATLEFCIKTPSALSDATENYVLACGLMDTFGTDLSTDALVIVYNHNTNSAKWHFVARDNGTGTGADTGLTVAANTWYKFRFEVNAAGTAADCYTNGVLACSLGDVLPTGTARATGPALGIYNINYTASTRTLHADYYRLIMHYTTPR